MSSFDYIVEVAKGRYDTIVEVEKFNPYHDAKGRFATAGSATSFTYAPGKSKAHDLAIQREKERHAAAASNPTNDPGTIAGVKRGQPMTHEQADEGRANPGYGRFDAAGKKAKEAERKFWDAKKAGASEEELMRLSKEVDQWTDEVKKERAVYGQYRNNCQSCVVAYEARRRGYDVEATGRTKNNQIQEALASHAENAWIDPATGKRATMLHNDPKTNTAKQATKWLDQNVEEGGRYEFSHGWKGTNGRNGHIVTIEKKNGALNIFDPQSGKTYAGDDFTDYMSRIKSTYSTQHYDYTARSGYRSVSHGRLGLLRVDNLQLNETVANAVLKGAGQ